MSCRGRVLGAPSPRKLAVAGGLWPNDVSREKQGAQKLVVRLEPGGVGGRGGGWAT